MFRNYLRRLRRILHTGRKPIRRPRRRPKVDLVSASHVLTVNGDQLVNHDDTITLDANGNGVRVTLNGETARLEPGQISCIVVNTLTGTDTVNIERTLAGVPVTVDLGSGTDTVNISPAAHNLSNIGGAVNVNGGAGTVNLTINDQNSRTRQTYTVNNHTFSRPGSGVVTINDDVDSVTLNGSNAGSGMTVLGVTNHATPLTLNTGAGSSEETASLWKRADENIFLPPRADYVRCPSLKR
jgi:hypothetical protein